MTPNKSASRTSVGGWVLTIPLVGLVTLAMPALVLAGQAASEPTFAKDIAPILQRSCQTCHRPDSVAPMSLLTYQQARPWARAWVPAQRHFQNSRKVVFMYYMLKI